MQSIDAAQMRARRDEFLLPIGPDTAQVLHTLIKGAKSRSILELGTSYGYSTLWLADAARAPTGKVVSLELAADKALHARAALARAGVAGARVDIQVGNALEMLPRLAGPFGSSCCSIFGKICMLTAWILSTRSSRRARSSLRTT